MTIFTWAVLRQKRVVFRGHCLVVNKYADLVLIGFTHLRMFEFIIFEHNIKSCIDVDIHDYTIQLIKCKDNMRDIRSSLKMAYKTSTLGHVYVINELIPMYCFLKEWYVMNYLEVYQLNNYTMTWSAPHVVVFDLDSTLITDEEHVNIRCENVYKSLEELKNMGCVLVLWSYGNREHVTHSMRVTQLNRGFFDITICGGYKVEDKISNSVSVDARRNLLYINKPFYSDVGVENKLPKSPRVVLWYLRKAHVNYIKTITLVDDLESNDFSYDYFVHVKKCSEPRDDWSYYHDEIVDNISQYNLLFNN